MTIKQTLINARNLISNPEKWTKGEYAKDADDNKVSPRSSSATCFCLMGAIRHVQPENAGNDGGIIPVVIQTENLLRQELVKQDLGDMISLFNDEHDHTEIISFLDKVIENYTE